MPRDQAPAASTTTSAATLLPSASTTPSARAAVRSKSRLTAVCSWMMAPAALGGDRARRPRACGCRPDGPAGSSTAPASLPARCGSRRRVSAAEIHSSGRPSLLLEREMMLQPRLIVGGQREHQRALAPQLDVDPGRLLRAPPRRPASAPGSRARARPGLPRPARPRQQAASMPAAAWLAPLTGGALVEHRHRGAARGQPPGDAEADHAGADDGDVRLFGNCVRAGAATGGSLRWNDPDRSTPRKYYQGFRLSNTPMGAHWRQRVFRYAVKPSRASSVPPAALRPAFHVCPWGNELPPATTRSGPR